MRPPQCVPRMASVEDRARGVGVETVGGETSVSGRAPPPPADGVRRWAPAFDPVLAALDENLLAHQPIETRGRGGYAGRLGATRRPDDDADAFRGVPTRRLGPGADHPGRPPAHPLGVKTLPNVTTRGHPPPPPGKGKSERATGPANLRLKTFGLPPAVVNRFVSSGIKSGTVYPWQRAAIDEGADGSNLVYCAPTSGGKSLVANVLLVRALAKRAREGNPGRALVILPFQSLVNEKVEDLKKLLAPMYKRGAGKHNGPDAVRGFAGESEGTPLSKPLSNPGQEAVAVVTIEKANVCVSRLIAEGRIDELCAVVVDELHMVGDDDRGYTLESTLAKLRFHERKRAWLARDKKENKNKNVDDDKPQSVIHPRAPPQIIAMSATVSHDSLERLAGWLNAKLFVTNYRPVPLTEFVIAGDLVFAKERDAEKKEKEKNQVCSTNALPGTSTTPGTSTAFPGNQGALGFHAIRNVPQVLSPETLHRPEVLPVDCAALNLAAESAKDGFSTLLFCPSRNKTEALALSLTRAFRCAGTHDTGNTTTTNTLVKFADTRAVASARTRLRHKLTAAAEGSPNQTLMEVTSVGIGFHHAHLRAKEKEAIEEGFRDGALLVLACTTTLAAGVNLPARRVVIIEGAHPIKPDSYRQMAGRAGRAGHAAIGESFVIPSNGADSKKRIEDAFALVASKLPATRSKLLLPEQQTETKNVGSNAGATLNNSALDPSVQRIAALTLQCVTSGLFVTQRDGFELLRSTLAFGVFENRDRLGQALNTALRHLSNDERLIETVDDTVSGVRKWRATTRGEALHRSALPVRQAVVLYEDLYECARHGIFLEGDELSNGGNVSFGRLHVLFLCVPRGDSGRGRNPLDLKFDWAKWYETLVTDPALRELGEKLGVSVIHAQRARATGGGGGGNPELKIRFEKHKRLAAAACLQNVLEGGDLHETALRWSAVAGIALLPGTLQQLQADTGNIAAMGANLAITAGWRGVAELLSKASKELDTGARRELAALTSVSLDRNMGWTMTVARARALFKAGFRTPDQVATAGEGDVADAVAKADAGLRGREKAKKNPQLETSAAATVSARRVARELMEACRFHEMRRLSAVVAANSEYEHELNDDQENV